jgi:hypothetical protein
VPRAKLSPLALQAVVLAAGWAEVEAEAEAAAVLAGAALVAGPVLADGVVLELLELPDEQPAVSRPSPKTQTDAVTDLRNRTKCLRRS